MEKDFSAVPAKTGPEKRSVLWQQYSPLTLSSRDYSPRCTGARGLSCAIFGFASRPIDYELSIWRCAGSSFTCSPGPHQRLKVYKGGSERA